MNVTSDRNALIIQEWAKRMSDMYCDNWKSQLVILLVYIFYWFKMHVFFTLDVCVFSNIQNARGNLVAETA
jgi:hypothetical protein